MTNKFYIEYLDKKGSKIKRKAFIEANNKGEVLGIFLIAGITIFILFLLKILKN